MRKTATNNSINEIRTRQCNFTTSDQSQRKGHENKKKHTQSAHTEKQQQKHLEPTKTKENRKKQIKHNEFSQDNGKC